MGASNAVSRTIRRAQSQSTRIGGGWLLLGFFRRLNLFALAVPVFCGNAFASSSSMMLMVFGV